MRSRIHSKSLFLTLATFIVIGTIGSSLLFSILNRIAVKQGENYLNAHTLQHKNEMIRILENAGRVTNLYSESPEFQDFILNESDPNLRAKAFEKLTRYMLIANSEGWFIAIKNSDNFYFNNLSNDLRGSELNRKLFIGNLDDNWFYSSNLDGSDENKTKNSYTIRIDRERITDNKKVWINKKIFINNKVEAIFGCTFDYSKLTDSFLKDVDAKIETFITLKDGSIVANKDFSLVNQNVDYLSFEERKNIFHIYNTDEFKINFENAVQRLKTNTEEIINFNIKLKNFSENKSITTVSAFSINNLNWYMVSTIRLTYVIPDKYKIYIMLLFFLMGILTLTVQVYFIKLQIVQPINNLHSIIKSVKNGELNQRAEIIKNRDDEITSLIFEFNNMLDIVEKYNKNSSELYSLLTQNMIDVVWLMDKHGNILYISPSIENLTGFSQSEAMLQSIEDRYSYESANKFTETILQAIQYHNKQSQNIFILKLEQNRKNNSPVWVEINIKLKVDEVHGMRFIGSTRDISQRLESEQQIESLLFKDSLTGLVNRKLLISRLQQTLNKIQTTSSFCAVINLNIDDFKRVNESFNFKIGDHILVEIGERLLNSVRDIDTVARISGDEFIILIDHIGLDFNISSEIGYLIAEKIKYHINKPYKIENEDKNIHLTCSIGLRIFDNTDSIDNILREANLSMNRSKHEGKNKITFWA